MESNELNELKESLNNSNLYHNIAIFLKNDVSSSSHSSYFTYGCIITKSTVYFKIDHDMNSLNEKIIQELNKDNVKLVATIKNVDLNNISVVKDEK